MPVLSTSPRAPHGVQGQGHPHPDGGGRAAGDAHRQGPQVCGSLGTGTDPPRVPQGHRLTPPPAPRSTALNCVLPIDHHLLATGDDGGELKVWDLRKGEAILESRQHEEYISAMAVDGNKKILLTARYCRARWHRGQAPCPSWQRTWVAVSCVLISQGRSVSHSGDGTMGVFNIKRRRFELLSEPQNGDLTSVTLLKVGAGPCCIADAQSGSFFAMF